MRIVKKKNKDAADFLTCAQTVIKNIISRNYRGYKVKMNGEWYEISVCACEPPDTDSPIADVDP